MSSYDWYFVVITSSSVILILAFGATLVRILRGSRLMNVAVMTGLLLIANIFAAAASIPSVIGLKSEQAGDLNRAVIANKWANVLLVVNNIGFLESHWLLAMHYWKTSTNTPQILRKEKVDPLMCAKVVFWIGISICFVVPILQAYYDVRFYSLYVRGQLTTLVEFMATFTIAVE